ncbi:hypothetical protein B0A48_14174 [Cryoendolithus antarcticus]|uniref:Uncharacterized protein n=1 Tax=Cryoendolithus antarcticus TaxID=1507870 RepID=A0A1V8SLL1_9PEZI|nr:hypothetical protein B0A48_14174 [Cryoendolithus antarcticus]
MASRVPSAAPLSGSKRKREANVDLTYGDDDGHFQGAEDSDTHTPTKRSRLNIPYTDDEITDDATPVQSHNVRRKKGVNNLSNLNLRHAAQQQARAQAEALLQARESRFQEGSLTDKPSDQPPSVFTRMIRTDSGNIKLVDDLMADYHDEAEGGASTSYRISEHIEALPAMPAPRVIQDPAPANPGIFSRLSRTFGLSMHPVKMWKDVWNETKEELTQKNLADMERKRLMKEEAEAKYAQMKSSGGFTFKPVFNFATSESITPHDSGVSMSTEGGAQGARDSQDTRDSLDTKRVPSYNSRLTLATDDFQPREQVPPASMIKTIKSRLHFKRPSLANIRGDLKRMASSNDLLAPVDPSQVGRDPSSLVSPLKTDMDFADSALKRPTSKLDLRRQHKLSKRVSDLEVKLRNARVELDEALVEASPMPTLRGRYEKFTSGTTLKRPKFVPGKLASLPSERLLDPASLMDLSEDDLTGNRVNHARDVSADMSDWDGEETIKQRSRAGSRKPYPRRATSLFKLTDRHTSTTTQQTIVSTTIEATNDEQHHDDNMEIDTVNQATTEVDVHELSAAPSPVADVQTVDLHTISGAAHDPECNDMPVAELEADIPPVELEAPAVQAHETSEPMAIDAQTTDKLDYGSLDAKLKALDASVKAAKKAGRPKKRKSNAAAEDLKEFKLGKTDAYSDEDSEWESAKSKKKRKSAGATRKGPVAKTPSPASKITKPAKVVRKPVAAAKASLPAHITAVHVPAAEVMPSNSDAAEPAEDTIMQTPKGTMTVAGAEAAPDSPESAPRASMDSQTALLEPLYEEEEETSPSASNASITGDDDVFKPTFFKAVRPRSRSASPRKEAGTEERLMVKATKAVWEKRDGNGRGWGFEGVKEESGNAEGAGMGKKGGEAFEWPEDVF